MIPLRGKRASWSYWKNWAETYAIVLLIIGFVISLAAGSAVMSYIIIFLSGMFAGRLMYFRKRKLNFPFYLIIIGFLLGYLLGSFYGRKDIIIICFILGFILSYYLHEQKYLE
ncbi:hypothetical protein JXB02_03355 [Candidatus Woesearchaeota archaeon]|nr:hypothetical protein [Candidatus Woesearchaeota archaeon]